MVRVCYGGRRMRYMRYSQWIVLGLVAQALYGRVWAAEGAEREALLKEVEALKKEAEARDGRILANKALEYETQYPLHVAAQKGDAEKVTALLKAGAAVNGKDLNGNTPLLLCQHRIECSKLLLEAGADVNSSSKEDRKSALQRAAIAEYTETVALYLRYGAKLDIGSAVLLGKTKEVEQFLQQDPKLIQEKFDGLPLLHWAVYRQDKAMCKLLIEHRADINARAGWCICANATALWVSVNYADVDLTKWLLEKSAETNVVYNYNREAQGRGRRAMFDWDRNTHRTLLQSLEVARGRALQNPEALGAEYDAYIEKVEACMKLLKTHSVK